MRRLFSHINPETSCKMKIYTYRIIRSLACKSYTKKRRAEYINQRDKNGYVAGRYLNRLRLIKARHLLRHTDESVTDIAYRCGFGDSNHFSTLFRREFSWSPRDIRQGKDASLQ